MMKKYLIIIGGFVVVGVIALCLYIFRPVDERKLTKQLFGIDEDEYTVISRDNELSKEEYGGGYNLILKVKENQMESFLSEIKGAGFYISDSEERLNNRVYIENSIGLELNDKMKVYSYLGSVKRSISAELTPKTVGGVVAYSESVNGYYEVYLNYSE